MIDTGSSKRNTYYASTTEWLSYVKFAAIKADGSVVTWGGALKFNTASQSEFTAVSGDTRYIKSYQAIEQQLNGDIDVTRIYSNLNGFAALRVDGSVVTWGDPTEAQPAWLATPVIDPVAGQLDGSIPVIDIYSNRDAFAALRADGSVVYWGGAWGDSSKSASLLDGTVDVIQIVPGDVNFYVLRADGQVITPGFDVVLAENVAQILDGANAYLHTDGSISIGPQNTQIQGNNLLDGSIAVTQFFSINDTTSLRDYAALRADGSVVISHFSRHSGTRWDEIWDSATPVTKLFKSNWGSCLALREDGSVVDMGRSGFKPTVIAQLDPSIGVKEVMFDSEFDVFWREDGSVIIQDRPGGYMNENTLKPVNDLLNGTIDVVQIATTGDAFAALRADGSVVTWGMSEFGGDSAIYRGNNFDIFDHSVASELDGTIDVVQLTSNYGAFSALRIDGSVITWGSDHFGANSQAAAASLQSGVVALADVFSDNHASLGNVNISLDAANTLTATSSIRDVDGVGAISYQWLTNGQTIDGATGETYVLDQSQAGKRISVVASYVDGHGTTEHHSSDSIFNNQQPIATLTMPAKGAIKGGSGSDVIDGTGSTAKIKLAGGLGNDAYIVDSSKAIIKEATKQGTDTVYASVNFTLGSNLENLVLTGDLPISGKGNSLANVLVGNSADNILHGKSGNDQLQGGSGNDQLFGDAGNDVLYGNAGNDVLVGGAGSDQLIGEAGEDIFVFDVKLNAKNNIDTLVDFTPGEDKIQLKASLFKKLGASVTDAAFWVNDGSGASQPSSAYLIYDSASGYLSYDADGIGNRPAVKFALVGINDHPDLAASDFVVAAGSQSLRRSQSDHV